MTVQASAAAEILLVEDHHLIAQSLGMAFAAEQMQVRIADLTGPEQLMASVAADPPDIALVDLELGGEIGDGTALIRPLTDLGVRVLVVSAVTDWRRLVCTLEHGAVGYLSKSGSFDNLLESVLKLVRGEHLMSPEQRQHLVNELRCRRERERGQWEPFDRLTRREQQVLGALGNGRSVACIAEEWVVSEATVRSQVRGVLMKLGVGSQLEAVALATRAGWSGHQP